MGGEFRGGGSADFFYSASQQNTYERHRCGAEFLPSPMASKAEFALTSEPALVRQGHLTAVAVTSDTGHAVAFLGTATGEVRETNPPPGPTPNPNPNPKPDL